MTRQQELQQSIKDDTERIDLLQDKIFKQREELFSICDHSNTEIEHNNIEGGYLNVAEYHKILMCNICGKELDKQTTYGGFS